jgi:hypothetical protein
MTYPLLKLFLLTLLIMLFPVERSGAEQQGESRSTMDNLERTLELDRHRQLLTIKSAPDSMLTEFTTDGCSGGLSVGWTNLAKKIEHLQSVHGDKPPWESCCVDHDKLYHQAGIRETPAVESFELRREADRALRMCVRQTGITRVPELSAEYDLSAQEIEFLYGAISDLMYHAVRIGGIPCSGLPWRWGYGWPECD